MTGGNWIHLCIDMQRMFAEDTPWHVSWMREVCPQIQEIARRHPHHTIFTRFIPPNCPEEAKGTCRRYYEKWGSMTVAELGPEMVDLVAPLNKLVPPARIFDKMTYSPWVTGELHGALNAEGVDTLAITGGETDVCVLAAAIGAIDLGYRVIILKDAVCSGADRTHDASLKLLDARFSVQVELSSTEEFLRRL